MSKIISMTEQEYWKAQFGQTPIEPLEIGDVVEYKGKAAKVTKLDNNKEWVGVKFKLTGEFRLVKIEDLLIESEKK